MVAPQAQRLEREWAAAKDSTADRNDNKTPIWTARKRRCKGVENHEIQVVTEVSYSFARYYSLCVSRPI